MQIGAVICPSGVSFAATIGADEESFRVNTYATFPGYLYDNNITCNMNLPNETWDALRNAMKEWC